MLRDRPAAKIYPRPQLERRPSRRPRYGAASIPAPVPRLSKQGGSSPTGGMSCAIWYAPVGRSMGPEPWGL